MFVRPLFIARRPIVAWLVVGAICLLSTGCYAPLRSFGVPASTLPEEFRAPQRTGGPELNYSNLTAAPPDDYYLGPDDILEVTIPGLFDNNEIRPIRVQVMSSGEIQLPLVGAVPVGGLNLLHAQHAINKAYANGFLAEPRVSLFLAEKATINVVVLGKVNQPGVVTLPRYENDVAHALAQAGGLAEDAADLIEVHRKAPNATPAMAQSVLEPEVRLLPGVARPPTLGHAASPELVGEDQKVVKIPLRGADQQRFDVRDVVLKADDVIVVPSRRNEVFYVVGPLNNTSTVRFTAGGQERELGNGFILPRDREVDVVTAVAMAGYIDPIYSPTTVTVHRTNCGGEPFLIHVDLIKARYCREENVNVHPGDIIYLNPDANWYFRRTFDRVVIDLLTAPYRRFVGM